jgi:tetratricopeptide (TPR) repeat protein
MMDRQQFLDKLERLKKDDAKPELWRFLKLWMREGKSKLEVAKIIRKKTDLKNPNDVTIFSRRLKTICEYFGITVEGKGTHEAQLAYLFRKHVPDFVHPNVCPDAVDIEILNRPQPLTNPQSILTPEPSAELTTLEFIGRDRDLTNLANLRNQYKIVLIKAGAGVGKSTLAREFLQTHFKKVIRIEMGLESGNVTPAEEKVAQILRKDFDEEPGRDFGINLDILREKLADRANPIGVLIDNLEPALDENYRFREKLRGYDALLAVLGDRDVCSFTLITSRRSLIATRARVHEYLLEGLDITAWRQYFHDCENGADSEALLQMCVAYNGNAKVMDILHGAIKNRFDGNIAAYWSRYKDALLADSELETLISVEMDWLRDNQPNAYKLLCRMGCYQDVKTVPFEGLICLLWDVPESRQIWIVNYLSKTSLIEFKKEYHLHPAVREAAKSHLIGNKINWEETNKAVSNFYLSISGELKSPKDGLILLESFYHAISSNDLQKAVNLLIPSVYAEGKLLKHSTTLTISKIRAFGYISECIACLEILINHREKITNSIILTHIYGQAGGIYTIQGGFKKGISAYKNSLSLNKEFSNEDMRINHWVDTNGALSLIYIQTADYIKATKIFNNILQDVPHLSHEGNKYLCYIYACLSFSYYQNKNHILSKKQIAQSIEFLPFLESCSHTWIKSYGLYYLTRTLIMHNMFSDAQKILKKLQSFAIENSFKLAQNLEILGEAYLHISQNNFFLGVDKLLYARKEFMKAGAKYEVADTCFQIGLTYQAMGEHDQAKEYKAKALELFAQMEAPKQIERVNKAFGGNIQ